MIRHGRRALTAAVLAVVALSIGVAATPVAVAADPTGPALLTAVDVHDMGTFDRVTFSFRTTVCTDEPCTPPANPLPVIAKAEYVDPPVLADPSGEPVPVAGGAVLQLVMTNASGVDLAQNPPTVTYTGPRSIEANLPSVVELVETGDFESVLSWAIGVRDGAAGGTAQVLTGPTQVVVDVPHVVRPVVIAPTFTG